MELGKRGQDATGIGLRDVELHFRSVTSVHEAVMEADEIVDETRQLLARQ